MLCCQKTRLKIRLTWNWFFIRFKSYQNIFMGASWLWGRQFLAFPICFAGANSSFFDHKPKNNFKFWISCKSHNKFEYPSVLHRPPEFNTSVLTRTTPFSTQNQFNTQNTSVQHQNPSVPHWKPLSSTPKPPQFDTKNPSVSHML